VLNLGEEAYIGVPEGAVSADTVPQHNLHFLRSNYCSIFSIHALEDSKDCALQIQVFDTKTQELIGISNLSVKIKRPPALDPSDLEDPEAIPV
jgi:hypothetical protein